MKHNELKELIRQVVKEESEYQQLFKHMLDRTGKSIPDMSDAEKVKFFTAVDKANKAKSEGKLTGYNETHLSAGQKKNFDKFDPNMIKYESVNEEALPKDGSTIKVSNIPVKIKYVSNKKYIGYSWKDKNNKEHYEETKTSDHSNLNSLIKTIKINLAESVNEASLQKGKTYGGSKCEGSDLAALRKKD